VAGYQMNSEIVNGAWRERGDMDLTEFLKKNQTYLSGMNQKAANAFEKWAAAEEKGEPIETDFSVWYTYMNMVGGSALAKRSFMNKDLDELKADISTAHLMQMTGLQLRMKEASKENPEEADYLDILTSQADILKRGAGNVGLKALDAQIPGEEGQPARDYLRRIEIEQQQAARALGRDLHNDELSDIVTGLNFEIMSDPTAFWESNKNRRYAYQATDIPGVPPLLVDDLARDLYQSGEVMTDGNIQLAHLIRKSGMSVTRESMASARKLMKASSTLPAGAVPPDYKGKPNRAETVKARVDSKYTPEQRETASDLRSLNIDQRDDMLKEAKKLWRAGTISLDDAGIGGTLQDRLLVAYQLYLESAK